MAYRGMSLLKNCFSARVHTLIRRMMIFGRSVIWLSLEVGAYKVENHMDLKGP